MSDTERVHIWSNGTEFDIWESNNCCKCIKRDAMTTWGVCELRDAISMSMIEDCKFAPEIAARLGHAGEPWFWCSERRTDEEGPKPAALEMAEAGALPLPGFES